MLFKKMLRDMSRNKTQFISIFLMAFLGVFIFIGIGGEWQGLQHTSDEFYTETNMADIWLYGEGFAQADIDNVASIDGVTGVQRRLMLPTIAKLEGSPSVTAYCLDGNSISKPYLMKGAAYDADAEGIWLDDRFADAHGLKVGDRLELGINGFSLDMEILGTVYSPEYVFMAEGDSMTPDFLANGFAFIPSSCFPVPEMLVYNQLLLTADTDAALLENDVENELDYSVFLTRSNHSSVETFQQEIEQHKAMGEVFPPVFVAIAMLTMLTTMTRLVAGQCTQIGTLKALGYRRRRIMLHYISYGFWLALAGAALGAVAGPLILPPLFYPSMSSFYTLPEWKPYVQPAMYLMAVATVLACTLITYIACRKVLKDVPAQALRPAAPRAIRRGAIERFGWWKRLGFNAQWNLRDLRRNKVRSLMTVVGVLGCSALLVCAFAMKSDMDDVKDWMYEDIIHYESKVTLEEGVSAQQVDDMLAQTNGETIMEGAVEIRANGNKKSGSITVLDDVTLITPTDEQRRHLQLPEGVCISHKMAGLLGVAEGDDIEWHMYGGDEWVKTRIQAIYRDPSVQGLMLQRGSFERSGFGYIPTAVLTPQRADGSLEGAASVTHASEITAGWEELTEAMMIMVYLLIAAAAVLAVVVLYNLGLLSFTEMERELATLKVIGFKSGRLRKLLFTQNLWLSLLGFALGVPAGRLLVEVMVSTMGESFDMMPLIHIDNIVYSIAITLGLSFFVNLLFSGKVKGLDMVGSLKGVE